MLQGYFVGAIFLMASAAPALAQSPARQSQEIFDVSNKESDYFENTFRHSNGLKQGAETYASALSFASCATRLSPQAVTATLGADVGSDAEVKAFKEVLKHRSTCVASRASVVPVLMRGALAETLWKQAGQNPNPAKRTMVDIEDVQDFIKAAPLGEQKFKAANLALSWVSRCQVMALPLEAAAVLGAAPGSPEEKAAAEALYAKSNVCGVTSGLGKAPPLLVRVGLADAFYQDGLRVKLASAR